MLPMVERAFMPMADAADAFVRRLRAIVLPLASCASFCVDLDASFMVRLNASCDGTLALMRALYSLMAFISESARIYSLLRSSLIF